MVYIMVKKSHVTLERLGAASSPITVFFAITLIVSACSIIYELLLSQLITVLFGNTVVQYSIVIGLYLFFLGVGSFFYGKVKSGFVDKLMFVEFAICFVSLCGIFGLPFLYVIVLKHASVFLPGVLVLAYVLVALIGFLSGFELPLLIRILEGFRKKSSFGETLGFDYFGALLGTVVYALLLYPKMGIFGTVIFVSFGNIVIALYLLYKSSYRKVIFSVVCGFFVLLYAFLFLSSGQITQQYSAFYQAERSLARFNTGVSGALYEINSYFSTPYQDVLDVTVMFDPNVIIGVRNLEDRCIFIDTASQLCESTIDMYHTGMVDIPMLLAPHRADGIDVLVIGGGDFIGIRHLLDYPFVRSITHVDIDGDFVEFMKNHEFVSQYHKNSYESERVTTHIEDGFMYVVQTRETFDVVILDLPHYRSEKLLPLYSIEFTSNLHRILRSDGFVVTWGYDYTNPFRPFDAHGRALLSTYAAAGFTHIGRYASFFIYEDRQVQEDGERFMLFSKGIRNADMQNVAYSPAMQIYYDTGHFVDIRWDELSVSKFVDSKWVNSIFKPNYAVLVKNY
jgi:spermidine synthase